MLVKKSSLGQGEADQMKKMNLSDGPTGPNYAVWMLHRHCNMHCDFCITDGSLGSWTAAEADSIRELVKRERFSSIILGGGEPLLWREGVFHLAGNLHVAGFETQLGTNGIALEKGFEFREEVDRYILPLDGPDPETHEKVRKYHGGHHALIRDRIETCLKAGKSLTLSTVVSKVNFYKIQELAMKISDWQTRWPHIHAWHLYKFVPAGRGGEKNAENLTIPSSAFDDCVQKIRALVPIVQVFKRSDLFHSQNVEFFWKEDGDMLRRWNHRVIRFNPSPMT